MYEPFYKLSTHAFRLTPDPKFCFAHTSYSQARAYLEYALTLGEGFIMVTGRPGTGKTTLIESFINELEMGEVVAESIIATNLEATDLLRAVAYAYEIDAEGLDKATLRLRIQQFFTRQVQSGRRVLLIIDEAQGLSHPALEELRLLADLQTDARPLLQLFLVGQQALRDLMRSPDMEQFQQRVIGTCRLEPLNLRDTKGYVEYRLRQADWQGDPAITGEAVVAIYQHSRGVPRHINKTCTRLLFHGLLEGKHELDEGDVLTIAAELCEEQLGPQECNQAGDTGTPPRMPVPELENGALSIAELALRADSKALKHPAAPSRPRIEVQRKPAARQAGRRQVARRVRSMAPMRQPNRLLRQLAARWPDIVALSRTLQQHGIEAVRKLEAGLQSRHGPAIKLGMLAVITLSVAVLTANLGDDSSDYSALLSAYSKLSEERLPAARLSDMESAGVELFDAKPKELMWHDTQSRQMAVHNHGGSDTRLSAAGTKTASEAARQPVPESLTTDTPQADVLSPTPESRQVAEASDVATAVAATNDEAREPLPSRRAEAVAMHDRAPPDKDAVETGKTVAMTEINKAVVQEATELAVIAPIEQQRTSSQRHAADDPVAPAPVSLETKIEKLLSLGKQALNEDRLLIPSGNSAHYYYKKVLTLDPGNTNANAGIERIVRRYAQYAERALEREDEEKTKVYIGRGLRIRPADSQILALQERMNAWLSRIELEAMQLPVAPPPPPLQLPVAEPPTPEPKGFMSRLKAFFSKDRLQDQGNDIWSE